MPDLAAVLVVGAIVGYGALCGHIEHRLERAVADKLDAELQLGRLLYIPPLGVHIGSAHLVRKNNVLADFGRVDLKLGAWPRKGRPVVIDDLTIRQPIVRIFKTDAGLVGGPGFVKDVTPPPEEATKKFSDKVRIGRFHIAGATIKYDQTQAERSTSMAWHNVNASLSADRSRGAAAGAYHYELTVDDDAAVRLRTTGSIDADDLLLAIDRFAMSITTESGPNGARESLPGEIQQILQDYRVGGTLVVNGHGAIPLRDVAGSRYEATVQLTNGTGHIPQWDLPLDRAAAALSISTEKSVVAGAAADATPGPAAAVCLTIDHVDVGSGGRSLSISGGRLHVDPAAGGWKLAELIGHANFNAAAHGDTPVAASRPGSVAAKVESVLDRLKLAGEVEFVAAADGPIRPGTMRRLDEAVRREVLLYPRNVTVQPTKFPYPLTGIGAGSVRISGNDAIFENLSAYYGRDRWLVTNARVALDALPEQITITEGQGSIEFHAPSPAYPKPLVKVVPALNPSGTFHVGGRFNADRRPIIAGATTKPVLNYDLLVNSDNARFDLGKNPKWRIPLNDIRGDAVLTTGVVDVRRFRANSLGGLVLAEGKFTHKPLAHPATFDGLVSLRGIDLHQVGRQYDLPDRDNRPLRGRGFANLWLAGELGPTCKSSLRGRGEVEVLHGDFFDFPVLVDILRGVKGAQAARAGEAAGVFRIDRGVIHIPNAAVSAPVFGLQGGGRIDLVHKTVDLNVVAAPFADWREQIERTRIPVVSQVGGAMAGAMQNVLNTATRQLLYEFRVQGGAKHPSISAVPAPALSDAGAALLGEMLGGGPKAKQKRPLIESVRGTEQPTSRPKE